MRKIKTLEYLIYEGAEYAIEWFFDINAKSVAFEFFNSLSEDEQDEFLFLVKKMADTGKIFNEQKFRNEGEKIFAFKPKPNRFLCFFSVGRKMIVTNGFQKKQDKLPPNEKARAITLRKDFLDRIKKGTYYEKQVNIRKNNGESKKT